MKKRANANAILIQCGDIVAALYLRVDITFVNPYRTISEIDPGFVGEVLDEFSDEDYPRAGQAYCLPFSDCCYLYELAVSYCSKKGVKLDDWVLNPETSAEEMRSMFVEPYDADRHSELVFA